MLVVPAHAKVNLALEVTARRPDGWHEIATVICTLNWHDLVGITVGHPAGNTAETIRLMVDGPFAAGVPADASNLAHRAAAAVRELAKNPAHTIDIWLCKLVPAEAGMGGGSADAAAVLRAGATLFGLNQAALHAAAAQRGSAVPALLARGTTYATGRGEQLAPLPTPNLHLAVALAGRSATAAAYSALTEEERRPDGRATRLAAAIAHHQPLDEHLLGSALEPAACRAAPDLARALQALRAGTPGHRWHLTGSGGAAFALAPDRATAQRLAQAATAQGFPARACRTIPP